MEQVLVQGIFHSCISSKTWRSEDETSFKLHILSGCDVTSKVGTKLAVMRRDGEAGSNFTTFNELRSTMYMKKNKSIIELPPTSNTIAFHLRRCCYFIRTRV